MEVAFSEKFKKVYQKRVKGDVIQERAFRISLELFISDPFDSRIKTHKLSGRLSKLWSFSVRYDLRVVFYFTEDQPTKAVFIDIGTHDEVY